MKKPIQRSNFRRTLGSCYYQLKRHLQWHYSNRKWACTYVSQPLEVPVFRHKTPLFRKLKDIDMWMQHNKVNNLEIAAGKLNKIIIHPGETFSFWRLVGKPTGRKGYLEGMMLDHGRVVSSIGGGLCQLSNLIYWAALHTPLTVTERHRHNYDVFPDSNRALPFGSGATCAYNYIDLQVYNPTNQPYQLLIFLTDTHLVGEWRAERKPELNYKVYEKEHWITQEYWGDYVRHNTIYRKAYNSQGKLVDNQYITENHSIMMYQPLLKAGNTS